MPQLNSSWIVWKRAAGDIVLHIKADKMEYMCFNQNQRGDISIIKGGSLKLVDKFTCLGSSVKSSENDINTRLAKAWTTIDRLSVIWKSELSDKRKLNFFQAVVVSIRMIHHMDADKPYREKAWRQLHKNATSYTEQILEATSQKTAAVRTPTSYL